MTNPIKTLRVIYSIRPSDPKDRVAVLIKWGGIFLSCLLFILDSLFLKTPFRSFWIWILPLAFITSGIYAIIFKHISHGPLSGISRGKSAVLWGLVDLGAGCLFLIIFSGIFY